VIVIRPIDLFVKAVQQDEAADFGVNQSASFETYLKTRQDIYGFLIDTIETSTSMYSDV